MRVEAVELRRTELPLVEPLRSAYGEEPTRPAVLVRVAAGGVEGWGECAAMSAPLYTSEYADGAFAVLLRHLAPRVVGLDLDAAGVAAALAAVRGHPMAKAALEAAILDAELRLAGRSLAEHLGAVRELVPAGIALGLERHVPTLLDAVAAALAAGYQRVKLKIVPGWDVEPVRAVRERFPGALLQVDANGAYSPAEATALAALDDCDLACLEQALPPDDLAGHAELAARLRTPLCLDESITSAEVAARALDAGACRVVCVKPGHVGGYLEAVRVHDACVARGAPVWVGGMLETGLGRAANLALAALPGCTLPGDLSASDRWFREDLTEPFVLEDGHLRVPAGPGIGVTPLPGPLARATRDIETVRP